MVRRASARPSGASAGARGARAGQARRLRGARARPALRRPAPARRARPRAGQPAQGAAARRAARRARPQAARGDAGRAEVAAAARSASPSSSSPTTRARRCRWPTASPSSTTGRIVQVGTPEEIYERPRTRFVADFVGSSNVLPPDFAGAWPAQRALGEPAAGEDRDPRARRASRARRHRRRARRSSQCHYQGADRRVGRRRRRAAAQRHRAGRRPRLPDGRATRVTLVLAAASALHLMDERHDARPRSAAHGSPRSGRAGGGSPTRSPTSSGASRAAARRCCSVPPLLWLGIVYLGSLFALLAAELLLDRRVLRPGRPRVHAQDLRRAAAAGQSRHHPAHRHDGRARHDGRRGHRLSDRLLRGALCARAHGRRSSISAVMLPLWSSYLVKVYAWKLILAKEGILTWLAGKLRPRRGCSTPSLALPVDRRPVAVDQLSSARSSSSSMSGCPS